LESLGKKQNILRKLKEEYLMIKINEPQELYQNKQSRHIRQTRGENEY
jgi:hypothetical protein